MNKKFICNPLLLIPKLKDSPMTYKTILNGIYSPTNNIVLRRKMSRICKDGDILKTTIPGTRHGEVIFYTNNKNYKIMVKNERFGVSIYYFKKYENIKGLFIKIMEGYILSCDIWIPIAHPLIFFKGDILKFF